MTELKTVSGFAPPPTDAEKAKKYRDEVRPILDQVCALIDTARRDGLEISFGLGPNQFGKQVVQNLGVVKPL